MNSLEDRLREAYREAAQTVRPETIRDLAGLPGLPGRTAVTSPGARRPHARRVQLAAPLAAAAAIAVIVVTAAVAVPRIWPGRTAGGGAVAQPGYVAAVVQGRDGSTALEVISTATGQVLGRIVAPRPSLHFISVAALGSDRRFVAEAGATNNHKNARGCGAWLYQFRLTAQGQPSALTPLDVPEVAGWPVPMALAASADGNTVAYTTARCTEDPDPGDRAVGHVGVISLRSATVRTWGFKFPAGPTSLSLSADGRLLSFVSDPSDGGHAGSMEFNSAWVLPTSSAPGPLQQHYRRVVRTPKEPALLDAAALSRSGKMMLTAVEASPKPLQWVVTVSAYETATGRLIRVQRVLRYHGGVFDGNFELSPSTSGRYLLVTPYHNAIYRLDLATGRYSAVPRTKGDLSFSAAW